MGGPGGAGILKTEVHNRQAVGVAVYFVHAARVQGEEDVGAGCSEAGHQDARGHCAAHKRNTRPRARECSCPSHDELNCQAQLEGNVPRAALSATATSSAPGLGLQTFFLAPSWELPKARFLSVEGGLAVSLDVTEASSLQCRTSTVTTPHSSA